MRRIDGWSVFGVFSFFNEITMEPDQGREPVVFCHTEGDAQKALAECRAKPDDRYDYYHVDVDSELDP